MQTQTRFLKKLLSIENSWDNARHIYWTVLNHETGHKQIFSNKLEAICAQRLLTHATIYFNWYEQLFNQFDFHREPTESYAELLRQRAQELRDRYGYIRLWFSGGSDSISALNAFIDNGIPLDEIIVYMWNDHEHHSSLESGSRELVLSAVPYLEAMQSKLAGTKITKLILNYDDYLKTISGPDRIGELSYIHSMDRGAHLFGLNCVQYAWEKVLENTTHDNYCDLFGGTKPTISRQGDNYYFHLIDTTLQDQFLSKRAEDFFISTQNPKLFFKTAHMFKNYVKSKNLSNSQIQKLMSDSSLSPMYNAAIGRDPTMHPVALYKIDRGDGFYSPEVDFTIKNYKHYRLVKNLSSDEKWRKLFKAHVETYKAMKHYYDFLWNTDDEGQPDPNLGYKGHISALYSMSEKKMYDNTKIHPNGFFK